MLICGKPVKEWVDAPYGAFAKAVRESGIDSHWGADVTVGDMRQWEVRIDYSYSGRGTKTIQVDARTEKEAEKLALEEFDNDGDLDFWDADVDDAEVNKVTKLD